MKSRSKLRFKPFAFLIRFLSLGDKKCQKAWRSLDLPKGKPPKTVSAFNPFTTLTPFYLFVLTKVSNLLSLPQVDTVLREKIRPFSFKKARKVAPPGVLCKQGYTDAYEKAHASKRVVAPRPHHTQQVKGSACAW